MKTLLIQDASGDVAVLKSLIDRGYEVVTCPSQSEAVASFRRDEFALVVFDLGTLETDAVALCCRIREEKKARRSFILLVIPFSSTDSAVLERCDADDVLPKPFDRRAMDLRLDLAERQIKRREESVRVEETLNTRAQQQVAIAALGQSALSSVDVKSIGELVNTFILQMLGVEFCYALELSPDAQSVRFESGFGWSSGLVGQVWPIPPQDSVIGHVLKTHEPVIANDLPSDTQFGASDFLRDNGIVSAINVAIKGRGVIFGVLGACTSMKRTFSEGDLHFMEGLSNVLGAAMQREKSDAEIRKLAAFPMRNPSPVLELNAEGCILYENEAARKLTKALGLPSAGHMLPPHNPERIRECLSSGMKKEHERVSIQDRVLSWNFYPIPENSVVHAYALDVTEQLSLQSQVQHLQRLESVGQLAAGLAHDYNNVLTIIHGHVTLVLSHAGLATSASNSLKVALEAVERASNLTRQLLVFSRKESMQAEPVDINTIIGNVSKLLDRLLGENIRMEVQPGTGLPTVDADPGLLEQVIINLALNARDAMARGGNLVISTALTAVDRDHTRVQPDAHPGQFICLKVSDTGCGMDEATLSRIFEPFFTTKAPGKGTGLGLATVYGIVKQHQGWVEVKSQVGQGTTFALYIPATGKVVEKRQGGAAVVALPRGKETILLIEDEAALRALARRLLENLGYKVLEAGSAEDALGIWEKEKGTIQVLLTDLVIPDGFTGFELAERLQRERPDLRIIVTSGYDPERISKGFLAKHGIRFIQKPYRTDTLARGVRESLDSPPLERPAA